MAESITFIGPLERVLYLKTLPAFAKLSPSTLAAVAQHARERHFAKGVPLLSGERPAETFYVVVDGHVHLRRQDGSVRDAGPGDEVGFVELLARTGHGLEARAETATLALEFDWDAHLDVCEEHSPLLFEHLRYLAASTVRALRRLPDGVWLNRAEYARPAPARPLNIVERILVLRQSNALASGSVEALAELGESASEVRFAAGAEAWKRGTHARSFLLLAQGSIECTGQNGRRLRHGGSALALGLNEALTDTLHWTDAVALDDVLALEVQSEALLDALEAHFDLARDLLSAMARRLLDLRERRRSTPRE